MILIKEFYIVSNKNIGLIQGKRDKKILKIFFFADKLKIVSLVDIMEGPCHLDPLWPLKVG